MEKLFTSIILSVCCIILCVAVRFENQSVSAEASSKIEVTHFFTHALIADTGKAFAKSNVMRASYDNDCVTVNEFKTVLNCLYSKNYVLVDVNKIYRDGKKSAFDFPKDKKPLLLSFDDINYYSKKMHSGMNDRLTLADGSLAAEIDGRTEYDNDVVTVVENFIKKHPDFTFEGARGVLCLTGFDGILGYRTNSKSVNRQSEISAVSPIVARLKKNGWRFACHSYGHYHMKKLTAEKFKSDTDKWLLEVTPLIGKTDIYVYPYGENDTVSSDGKITSKHEYLLKKGFSFFWGVGLKPYFEYLPKTDGKALFMDRIPLQGNTLRCCAKLLFKYFDCKEVYDSAVRPKR